MDENRNQIIEEDIRLLQAGDFSDGIKFSNSFEKVQSYLLIVSKSNRTLITVNRVPVYLSDNQLVVYPYIRQVKLVRGEGFFVRIAGTLAYRYLHGDMLDEIISLDLNDSLRRSIGALEAIVDMGGIDDPIRAAKICFSILLDLRMYQTAGRRIPRLVLDAVRIMEREYAFLFGVDSVADQLGVSKSYLIRLFREHLSVTPGKYLEELRIDRSKVLLASGEFNVDMVAKLCGYSNANYFGKVFKKNTGGCPGDYIQSGIADVLTPEIPPEFFV